MSRFAAVVTAGCALMLAFACAPIQGAPPPTGPPNSGCPQVNSCDAYDVLGAKTKPQCNLGRCEFSGRPTYDFTVIVDVPDSNFYAPGRTFVLSSADLTPQAGIPPRTDCVLPTCVLLPELNGTEGKYLVKRAAAELVGYPLPDGTSLPIRVSYVRLTEGTLKEAPTVGIPFDAVVTSSRSIRTTAADKPEVKYIDTVPIGRYRRIAYPEPPFDEFFPPVLSTVRVTPGPLPFVDTFTLGDGTPLDDDSGDSRRATVGREEGLDGWRVWLAELPDERRISSIHTLSGKKMTVRLDTARPDALDPRSLGDAVEVIVAPPDAWVGVPRLKAHLVNGQGLADITVHTLPEPAQVGGLVAHGDGAALTGVPSRLLFTSSATMGLLRADTTLDPLLHYTTVVNTDATGHFKTVLPPGFYDVTIEPADDTGFAKVKDTFDTSSTLAKTFHPPLRTTARGRILLTDGRPLAEADIHAIPSEVMPVGNAVKPRPAQTKTSADGTFELVADQGQYDFVVDPQAGTGFPRLVQLRSFATGTADLGDIQVAPPTRLQFKLRDPSGIGNPIVRAMVRIFKVPDGRLPTSPAVEIARAMTDETGSCEILLAH